MPESEIDLVRVVQVLNKHQVDYVVIGGMALILQGGDAVTSDIDLAFEHSIPNLRRLADALEELKARPKRWTVSTFRLQPSDLASKWLHLESDSGDIDLVAETPAVSYAELKHGSEGFQIEAAHLEVASLKELIAMKRATGRAKDAIHLGLLEQLLELRRRGC